MTHAVGRIDAPAVSAWLQRAAADLEACREQIDRLNVFPVADADTGTNLAVTLRAAADATGDAADVSGGVGSGGVGSGGVGAVLRAAAAAAALAARGNSGVIVGQWLRGLADSVGARDVIDVPVLADVLAAAAATAREAVSDPVEGTVLTIALAAADAASTAAGTEAGTEPVALSESLRAVRDAAAAALATTPAQLDVLGRAGVVDAGGQGLLIVLEALLVTVCGETAPSAPEPELGSGPGGPAALRRPDAPGHPTPGDPHGDGGPGPGWEVQYLLHVSGAAESVERLRGELDGLGTCVVLGRVDAERLRVHVHTDDVGAALEAGIRAGRPSAVEITALPAGPAHSGPAPDPGAGDRDRVLVAVVSGAGMHSVFAAAGAGTVELTAADPDAAASRLATAIRDGARDAPRVVVLPGSLPAAVVELACAAARREQIDVTVVPTHSPVQALAAVAVHDSSRRFGDDLIAMAEAAATTRVAEVRVATGEALTMAGRCAPGDVLGSIAGEIVAIGADAVSVAVELIDRLLAVGGELVTVLLGDTAPARVGAELTDHLAATTPHAEIVVHDAGQSDPPLIIGVE